MIYLDNAATSWPKPPEVLRAMMGVLRHAGGNPGRSGHRLSIKAARIVYEAREEVAGFFQTHDPLRVIFTGNATHALNIALKGLLKPGDTVVTTSIEHNAVMRPLRYLEKQGVKLNIVPCAVNGSLKTSDVAKAIDGSTRLLMINHASNVVGTILPVHELAKLAHRAGALILVDAAQSAGEIAVDVKGMGIDLLAFTGHKALFGPPGIGGLIIGEGVPVSEIKPFIHGGTGSQSEKEEQPEFLPDKFESGTPNLVGIAGLSAGIKWLKARGTQQVQGELKRLTALLIDGLSSIAGVRVYGTLDAEKSMAVVSFTVRGKRVSEVGLRLDEEYAVLTRVGLHCAPAAHKTTGTFPEGTVRLAPSIFTTPAEIDKALRAIERISRS